MAWAGDGSGLARSTAMRHFGLSRVPDDGLVHVVVDHRRKFVTRKACM